MKAGLVLARLLLLLIVAFMLALLAARFHLLPLAPRYDPFIAPDLRQEPYWLTATKLKVLDSDAASCSAALAQTGLNSALLPPSDPERACRLQDTVMVNRFFRATMKAEQTRCNIAARLYLWERFVVQPAARKYFNQPVKEVMQLGSYNCRTIHGSSRMSQHATANAFDISGLRLASGRAVTIKRSWNTPGPDSDFLHEVRDGSCRFFNLTLSPDYNADHADHLHVDMGWIHDCR